MTSRFLIPSIIGLCAATAAQHVSSPPGFELREGNSHTDFGLGSYPEGRFQYVDGHHRGSPMSIKATDFRPANFNYTAADGMGRSWTNVTLDVSQTDLATISTTFTSNPRTTPSRVFSGPVRWPTLTGKPANFPEPFSISFPFSGVWTYDGTQDICLDYTFSGGTLANSGAWVGRSSRRYNLDAHSYPLARSGESTTLGFVGSYAGCNDRGVTHYQGAAIESKFSIYSGDHPTASLRHKITLNQEGSFFPGNRPVLTFVGFRALNNGIPLPGTTCNQIHVDFSLPTLNIPGFATSNGRLVALNLAGVNPGGIDQIVTQVAWNDSITGQGLLSNAAVLSIPEEPPEQPTHLLFTWDPSAVTGVLSTGRNRKHQPIRRYQL